MAAHSVRRHLQLEIDLYDEAIRCYIPGYETMIDLAAREVARSQPLRVLDLGAGTGALSEAVLLLSDEAEVVLLDEDAAMLKRARLRLARFGDRVSVLEGSFLSPLPRCDAVMASLALHHVPRLEDKQRLFERIEKTLPPGGVFVNADATMPTEAEPRAAQYRAWADHLASCGIGTKQAYELFDDWAEEDTYFPREAERDAMRAAGFEVEWIWTEGPMVVAAGRKRPA